MNKNWRKMPEKEEKKTNNTELKQKVILKLSEARAGMTGKSKNTLIKEAIKYVREIK